MFEKCCLFDQVRSSEIRKSLNIEPLLLRIERSQLRWSKSEKTGGTTTNTLSKLHWRSWMEPLGASTTRNVGSGGGPWCVVDQSWAAAPQPSQTWAGSERRRLVFVTTSLITQR